jgi:thioester reductase-like protein
MVSCISISEKPANCEYLVLTALTPQRCATVFAPKVDGAWYLHQLTRKMDLNLFVMFSSTFGVMGMPGHGNYAAANTFLDALAHFRRARGLPATSIAYGAWEGGGMASGIIGTGTFTLLTQMGLDMLTPEEGLEQFEQAVRGRRALTIAAALDSTRLRNYYEERGGIPPLFRVLLGQSKKRAQQGWSLRKVLREVASEEHAGIILGMVRETVGKALGFSQPSQVDVDRPLQDIGIDSLTAILMRNQLASLTGLTLTARSAFQHPNLKTLSQFLLLELYKDESYCSPALNTFQLNRDAIEKGFLEPSFTFDEAPHDVTPPTSVFITGATGFVGAFIVYELLELGIIAHCLVRANSADQGKHRLITALTSHGLWKPEFAPLLYPIVGDMAQPLFGLSQEAFDSLADTVEAICHSGALVDWMRSLEDYIGPNIVSSHEVLRLASCGRSKVVHLVSTMSTLPYYMGYNVTEEYQEYGYATSKYRAERMLAAARWRGARASVYRLPFVTASSETGHFRQDCGDFLHNFISGCRELGAFPELDADLSAVLPVDYLAKTIAAVMTRDLKRIGQDYDFVNGRALSFDTFFGMMGELEKLPFLEWRMKALRFAAENLSSSLARIAAIIDGVTDEVGAKNMVTIPFVGKSVFGDKIYPVPVMDAESVGRYVSRIEGVRLKGCTGLDDGRAIVACA